MQIFFATFLSTQMMRKPYRYGLLPHTSYDNDDERPRNLMNSVLLCRRPIHSNTFTLIVAANVLSILSNNMKLTYHFLLIEDDYLCNKLLTTKH